jgi:hypothetical protein
MTDEQLTKALADLKTNADRLNAASNETNQIIESIERQIAATNVGLECWIELGRSKRKLGDVVREQDSPTFLSTVLQLGWTKIGDRWRLAWRGVIEEYRQNGGELKELKESFEGDEPVVALLSASREDRIEALKKLPDLIAALAKAAAESTAAINEAKKLIR